MSIRQRTKFVHEGSFVAEIDVQLIDDEAGWSPYLTVEDACKLDDVRDALRAGNLSVASKLARIYRLEPISV